MCGGSTTVSPSGSSRLACFPKPNLCFESFAGFVIMLHVLMLNLSQSGPKGNFCLKRSSFS